MGLLATDDLNQPPKRYKKAVYAYTMQCFMTPSTYTIFSSMRIERTIDSIRLVTDRDRMGVHTLSVF